MKWYRILFLWLLDACKRKMENDAGGNTDEKLNRIEQRLKRIENSAVPLGLFCSGLPILAIGFSGLVKNIFDSVQLEHIYSVYFGIGTGIISLSLMLFSNRVKPGIVTILVLLGIIIILYVLKATIL